MSDWRRRLSRVNEWGKKATPPTGHFGWLSLPGGLMQLLIDADSIIAGKKLTQAK